MRRNNAARLIHALLWGLVGIAKTMALVVLFTDADALWRDALAWLLLAFGLVAMAVQWRTRMGR